MSKLTKAIENLKNTKIKEVINGRIREFKEIGNEPCSEIFKELCFCILTANFNAEKTMKIQKEIGDGFLTLPRSLLTKRLMELGYRYPDTRAGYIVEARKYKNSLRDIVKSFDKGNELREWLVENIMGIGYKESSHFLRNIGFTDFAIVDFHIINILARYSLIEKPKMLTGRKYLEVEDLLRKIAEKANLNLAELDLYLWFMETGKILK